MKKTDWIKGIYIYEKPHWCNNCGVRHVDGKDCVSIKADRVEVETYTFTSNPTVRYNELFTTRYNVLDRARERMSSASSQ